MEPFWLGLIAGVASVIVVEFLWLVREAVLMTRDKNTDEE